MQRMNTRLGSHLGSRHLSLSSLHSCFLLSDLPLQPIYLSLHVHCPVMREVAYCSYLLQAYGIKQSVVQASFDQHIIHRCKTCALQADTKKLQCLPVKHVGCSHGMHVQVEGLAECGGKLLPAQGLALLLNS